MIVTEASQLKEIIDHFEDLKQQAIQLEHNELYDKYTGYLEFLEKMEQYF